MTQRHRTSGLPWWWYGLLCFMVLTALLIVSRLFFAIGVAPESVVATLASRIGIPALVIGAALLAFPLVYRRSLVQSDVLRKRGLDVLSSVQVTANVTQTLASVRGESEAPNYSAGQLALWRLSLARRATGVTLYDGFADPHPVLEIEWSQIVDVRDAMVPDGHGSAHFRGFVIEFVDQGGRFALDILPVGRGPGGATNCRSLGPARSQPYRWRTDLAQNAAG